jgi:N-acetylglucosaminyldiphosphoundecaprenol N-acetyl-beta-D-mannosaminyltransferase
MAMAAAIDFILFSSAPGSRAFRAASCASLLRRCGGAADTPRVKTGFAAAGGHPPEDARKRDAPAGSVPARRVLGLRVDATSYAHASDTILELGATGGGMTCVSTVHMVMEAFDAPDYQRIVNAAELVTPDGMPLVWMLRALGIPGATRVYGPDLTLAVCEHAERRGVPVGFYGGAPDVLDALVERLSTRFPQLRIAFVHSPPFTLDTPRIDPASADAILASSSPARWSASARPSTSWRVASGRRRPGCSVWGSSGRSVSCASRGACGGATWSTTRASLCGPCASAGGSGTPGASEAPSPPRARFLSRNGKLGRSAASS